LIEQKVILSFARDKNYDVDSRVEMIIKNIKEQNNITSDEELKKAIASQGGDYDQWKAQLKESSIQRQFIYEQIGSKIKIDNAEIMAHYKEHIKDYTNPAVFNLNCIFLNKENYTDIQKLNKKQDAIDQALKGQDFNEVAKTHTELPGSEISLGEFKTGELDPKLETAAGKLKQGEYSGWIETDTGYYIIKLVKYTEPQLVEYKKVRNNIEDTLRNKIQEGMLKDYLEKLKKESYIKIYEKTDK
jgi:hypothetical protein